MWIVYKATNLINGRFYIGKTGDLQRRMIEHKYSAFKTLYNSHFHNSIVKYGFDNFKWEVLNTLNTEDEAFKKEEELVLVSDKSVIYNLTSGGKKYKVIKKTRRRLDGFKTPDFILNKKVLFECYFNNPDNKKDHKEKTKAGMIKSNASKKISLKARQRWSNVEQRQMESDRKKKFYSENPSVRVTLSEKQKALLLSDEKRNFHKDILDKEREKLKRKVYCENNNKMYNSIKEASIDTGVDSSHITKICKGKRNNKIHNFKYL